LLQAFELLDWGRDSHELVVHLHTHTHTHGERTAPAGRGERLSHGHGPILRRGAGDGVAECDCSYRQGAHSHCYMEAPNS
jgi:hypothetical protein